MATTTIAIAAVTGILNRFSQKTGVAAMVAMKIESTKGTTSCSAAFIPAATTINAARVTSLLLVVGYVAFF